MKIKRFEFNMFPVNCYVLADETGEAVVIDPGCYYEEEKQALKDFIQGNNLQLKHLLCTHLHTDHMFGIKLEENPVAIGTYLHDGDLIHFGNTTLEAIHVPGHSPGSLVYYCASEHCMFSGDVLFQGSIGRADLSGGNFDHLIEHICSRLFVLPNDTVVYPGHGAPTTIGIEKAENPFFRS